MQLFLFLVLPIVTLQLQQQCRGIEDEIQTFVNIPCDLGDRCKYHWQVAILIATNSNYFYSTVINNLEKKFKCGSKDKVFFMSQSKWRVNKNCNISQGSSDFIKNNLKAYPFEDIDSTTTPDTLADMMLFVSNCLQQFSLNGKAAAISVLTDFSCNQLCTNKMLSYQYVYMNWLSNYYQYFGSGNQTKAPCKNIFAQCSWIQNQNHQSNCIFDDNTGFYCDHKTDDDGHFFKSMLILLISTVAPIILFPIGLLLIRIKQRVNLYIRRRSFRMKEAIPNEYIDQAMKSSDEWEVNPDNMEVFLNKPLGTGAFAIVYEGKLHGKFPMDKIIPSYKLRSEKNENVAVKRPPPHADAAAKKEFIEEIGFMKKLGYHSHILGMIGCLTTTEMPLMVLEYCEQGDLLLFLKRHRNTFSIDGEGSIKPKDLLSISWQISDGLCYLKSLELIHRDMAARNVLITGDLTAKISDFGLCRQPTNSESSNIYISRGGRLPVRWMAPESLRDYIFSFSSDVWSFGVVLWETFTLGEEPYKDIPGAAMLEALNAGTRLPKRDTIPDCIYKIMEMCWRALPKYRGEIEDIRNNLHEVLANVSDYYGYLSLKSVPLQSGEFEQEIEEMFEQKNREEQTSLREQNDHGSYTFEDNYSDEKWPIQMDYVVELNSRRSNVGKHEPEISNEPSWNDGSVEEINETSMAEMANVPIEEAFSPKYCEEHSNESEHFDVMLLGHSENEQIKSGIEIESEHLNQGYYSNVPEYYSDMLEEEHPPIIPTESNLNHRKFEEEDDIRVAGFPTDKINKLEERVASISIRSSVNDPDYEFSGYDVPCELKTDQLIDIKPDHVDYYSTVPEEFISVPTTKLTGNERHESHDMMMNKEDYIEMGTHLHQNLSEEPYENKSPVVGFEKEELPMVSSDRNHTYEQESEDFNPIKCDTEFSTEHTYKWQEEVPIPVSAFSQDRNSSSRASVESYYNYVGYDTEEEDQSQNIERKGTNHNTASSKEIFSQNILEETQRINGVETTQESLQAAFLETCPDDNISGGPCSSLQETDLKDIHDVNVDKKDAPIVNDEKELTKMYNPYSFLEETPHNSAVGLIENKLLNDEQRIEAEINSAAPIPDEHHKAEVRIFKEEKRYQWKRSGTL